ncbi:MAG TPA: hypothetical protein VJG83_00580 [archaeon]|nr:hypothetical protein [archaeon]
MRRPVAKKSNSIHAYLQTHFKKKLRRPLTRSQLDFLAVKAAGVSIGSMKPRGKRKRKYFTQQELAQIERRLKQY